MYSLAETRFGAAACKNKSVSGVGPVRRVPPQSGQYLCGGRRGIHCLVSEPDSRPFGVPTRTSVSLRGVDYSIPHRRREGCPWALYVFARRYSSETRFGAAACKNKSVSGVGPVRRVPPQSGQYLCGGRRGIHCLVSEPDSRPFGVPTRTSVSLRGGGL
ncbi:hypothetical protein DVH24_018751 [Malus domestica]|uniref:Uncharacterized protein n=1 Tax=Malus domestica TaxID=3750 RepID=A0A498HIV1_MALDO|nr:hypothetical protein DVH24_018751 [Malus domestica]